MIDRLLRIVTISAPFRCIVVWMPETAQTIIERHGASPFLGEALGNFSAASLLIASNLKGQGAVSLGLQSTGVIGIMNADGTPDGLTRAMIARADILDESESRRLKLPLIGPGTFTVVKRYIDERKPYTGIVEIRSPHIGPILADYLLNSEQVRSSVSVATRFDNARVSHCAGFLIEAFPEVDDDALNRMENNIVALGSFHTFLEKVHRPEELVEALTAGFKFELLREIPVMFHCPCNEDRVLKAILSAGRKEVEAMAESHDDIEIFCDYCRKRYLIRPQAIADLLSGK